MRRFASVLAVLAVFWPVRADALTLRDLVELSRAGLGDEVLLALIEVDRPVFSIDTETLKSLKAAGVSERVIVAVVRSGRTPLPVPAVVEAPPPEPRVIVVHHRDEAPRVREVAVPVAVPVYIPVVQRDRDRQRTGDRDGDTPGVRPSAPKAAEPVYWGWGGKRRPDTWKEPPKGK